MPRMPRALPIVMLSALLAPTLAAAQGPVIGDGVPIRAEDLSRLDGLDAAAGAALMEVMSKGSDDEVALAVSALRGPAREAGALTDASALAGDWNCRMTKLGGNLPAVSYPPFRCHIGADDNIMQFEKLTGSQRTRGTIVRDGDRWVYLGSTFVAGEQPKNYEDFPAEVDTTATETLPDVGVFEVTGPASARIIFPQPYRESLINVLTLTR